MAVKDDDDTNLVCVGCWLCLRLERGFLSVVDPATCPGCVLVDECRRRDIARRLIRLASEHP